MRLIRKDDIPQNSNKIIKSLMRHYGSLVDYPDRYAKVHVIGCECLDPAILQGGGRRYLRHGQSRCVLEDLADTCEGQCGIGSDGRGLNWERKSRMGRGGGQGQIGVMGSSSRV